MLRTATGKGTMTDCPTPAILNGTPTLDLSGRRVPATGGPSGVGAAVARAFAAVGAEVTVSDIDADAARSLADDIGGHARVADLADTASLEELELDNDILMNNAGVQRGGAHPRIRPGGVALHPPADGGVAVPADPCCAAGHVRARVRADHQHFVHARAAGQLLQVGVRGREACARKVLRGRRAGGRPARDQLELHRTGVRARTPLAQKQIGDQARTHGIPGDEVVEKIMLTEAAIKRMVEPEEVGSLATWLMSDMSGMITGASYTVDGGWTAI